MRVEQASVTFGERLLFLEAGLGRSPNLILDQLDTYMGGNMKEMPETGPDLSREDRIRAIMAKPWWDYEEVALVLNVDVKTLRNKKYNREISFSLFCRKVFFSRDQILKELRKNLVLCPGTAGKAAWRKSA